MSDETSGTACGQIRELIPEYASGALSAVARARVDTHVRACGDCAAELELAQMLFGSRAAVPPSLLGRIERAVASDRRTPARTWWGLSAAAIAALALGIGITSDGAPTSSTDVPGYAYEAQEGEIWVSDDGFVAGAPALDELSDEALEQLLDELTIGTTGGAA
ncbi:MAG: zf-HC2 domain-containing protein [Gemmatimonadetes bacterium]|nr:zf-HC2 domain-containing protein [Gemmatimonadota bacterium]